MNRSDWLLLIGQYPVILFVNYFLLGEPYLTDLHLFLSVTFSTTVMYVVFVWLMDSWRKYILHRYSALHQSTQRIALSLVVYIALTVTLCAVNFWIYSLFTIPGYRFILARFGGTALLGMVFNVLSAGVFEAMYFHGQWQKSIAREYELKQLSMQRQLNVLKQQVNPHFLFNSLNSLISLIGENPTQAEAFAEELSSVYRYVLRANDQDLTSLANELEFINSYYQLLKTRHGCGLNMDVCVDENLRAYQLPPLTLQLLIENAVKHNITLPEQPLQIWIRTDGQKQLQVGNTIQKKRTLVLSNGVGLSNIMAKYQMMGQPVPTVCEQDQQFVVTLPLIETA